MSDLYENSSIDTDNGSDDTLERLRNITKMFSEKDEEHQELQKVEKVAPSEKIKRTFRKFEEFGTSIDQIDEENEDENGISRSTRKKKIPKEHIPYHEMAEVKDKFEKGLVDTNKPRIEKRLDIRVQSGSTSSKTQAFEQGEFEREIDSHINKTPIETDIIAGLTSSKKQVFEQHQQMENENNSINKKYIIEHDVLTGLTTETKAKFERGEVTDRSRTSLCADEIATFLGSGLAQAKRSEILSKIIAEQQIQRSAEKSIDIDPEQGLATTLREQFSSLANSEFKSKSTEKPMVDVTAGSTNTIKEQYIADANKILTRKMSIPPDDIESGLTKNRTIVFENFDEGTVKRTVDIENELLARGVAKERVAMFKNLVNGSQSTPPIFSADSKIRVDENGNIVRESDKREEIYFEKGQTRQLVEQWKTKQISPEPETQVISDTEMGQQGQAKNLVQMWKTIDKENTPPPERPKLRPITPPPDNERHILPPEDNEINVEKTNYIDDKTTIESGYAKTVRERFLQNAEQNNHEINKRKTLKQITPPPDSPNLQRRKSITPPNNAEYPIEQSSNNEEFLLTKGQTKSLKNRFIELEQDARKVETSSSKIKYVPKRFVSTPAPKQLDTQSATDPAIKCSACDKTVYAMEKIEADKKIYHKSCFKCTHCKSILKKNSFINKFSSLGNYTANNRQIYCKPHFLQLFALKGNYSSSFSFNHQ